MSPATSECSGTASASSIKAVNMNHCVTTWFAASVGANGYDFSSSSFEAGLKLAVPFLPEVSFSIVKLPDDLK